jgi:hypothetical protein
MWGQPDVAVDEAIVGRRGPESRRMRRSSLDALTR